jgi:tight adherence protein B
MNLLVILFVVVLMLSFAIFMLSMRSASPSGSTWKRLVAIHDSVASITSNAAEAELEKADPWGYSFQLDPFLERFRFARNLKQLLLHADSSMGLVGIVLASAATGAGCGLITHFLLQSLPLAEAVMVVGCFGPYGVLRLKRDRRLKKFNADLPDSIDLMARALLAGHSVGASIEMVAEQSPNPIGYEFTRVAQQQRLGVQFREALLQLGSRVPSTDLQFLITAILVQKETGGDLTDILGRTSHIIRDRVRIRGEVRTKTSQGRMTGWILGLMPLCLMAIMNIVSPGYTDILFQDPVGRILLYAGGTLIVVGAMIIRKIVNVRI